MFTTTPPEVTNPALKCRASVDWRLCDEMGVDGGGEKESSQRFYVILSKETNNEHGDIQ